MLTGKKFDVNGSILEVIKEDADFAYLSGGAAIKKTTLLSSYDEYMDPNAFFNTSANAFRKSCKSDKRKCPKREYFSIC